MSSASIARQNRRMRLKQRTCASLNIHSKSTTHSTSEVTSDERSTNSDKDANDNCEDISSDSTNMKIADCGKSGSREALSYVSSSNFVTNDISSRPIEKIFIEGERGFKEINASEIFQISHPEISIQSDQENELTYVALKIVNYFHNLSNFCHGLLGGMSLLYILLLLHLFTSVSVDEETVKIFSYLSKPVHNVFNFLCVICCISTFDRFDITNTVELLKSIKKLDFRLIALIIYPVCLLMSLSTENVDDKLSMPDRNISTWGTPNFKEEESELYYWKILSVTKGFGALLGWIVICWDQNFNMFFSYMRSIQNRRKISLQ